MTGDWRVTYFDVGQGDATDVVLPSGKHVLIDAGPCVGRGGEGDGNALCDWFAQQRESLIQYAVITHNHADHFGGLLTLLMLPNVRIERVVFLEDVVFQADCNQSFKALLDEIVRQGIQQNRNPQPGCLCAEAGLELRLLFPPVDLLDDPPSDPNATSMILSLEKANPSTADRCLALWCGDAKIRSVEKVAQKMKPTWMMGPHHGKPQGLPRSSAFRQKIACVGPERLFLSFGRNNSHQHPCRDYIVGAHQAGASVTCSEVAKNCCPECKDVVFDGNGALGITGVSGAYQCRGSVELTFSATAGASDDRLEGRFARAVKRKIRKPLCGRPGFW